MSLANPASSIDSTKVDAPLTAGIAPEFTKGLKVHSVPQQLGSNSTIEHLQETTKILRQQRNHQQLDHSAGTDFGILPQAKDTIIPSLRYKPTSDKSSGQRDQHKFYADDASDPVTGVRKEHRLVGDEHHRDDESDPLTRTLRVTAPPFPGRLLRYIAGQPMIRGEDVRQWQAQMRRRGWNIDVDSVYGPQSARICTQFQSEKQLQIDGIVGPQTWRAAWELPITGGSSPAPAPIGNGTGQTVANLGRDIVEGKFNGGRHPRYVFGAENDPHNPASVKLTDCSELVQVVVSTIYGKDKTFVDGSWNQYAACQKISVAQALRTPGALLFIKRGGFVSHVEISLGNGYTAAARSTRSGVGVFRANIGFNAAGLIPGIRY